MSKSEHLLTQINEGIMHLTLNRPDRLNAFSPEMMSGLKQAIDKAKQDDAIRVVVLSGAGRAFSAGGDVKTMGQSNPVQAYNHIGKLNELILQMRDLDKPIISAVHGFAAGAGFNLALACDLILAAEGSKFVMSFSQVGLISDGGGSYFLPRLIGLHRAKELFFSAEPIPAEEARHLGLLNQIYPLDTFEENVKEYALKIASGPITTYGFIKKVANHSLTSNLDEILELERIIQSTLITTKDHQEGVQAFIDKRKPNFRQANEDLYS
ncbi:enoyl-CoA hydratase/isomerase family protein [Sporosarcina ureilytica]|uniref:Enoyl-CoA hydratase n=1 Tax=Sporosarcina ureilytica TaxID=298596 RepID=A0A1D8JJ36_9BACL|nr:enoyl-CoA hydratase [Sporosarcina ureilytica]AOV08700.1 enoyl-CoA hydratase [Sporosarcina ureilytica]